MLDHKFEPNPSVTRRVEVFTGTGRRRRWSTDDRARIVEETLAPGAVASEVARRHGISPQQLFGWRRAARRRAMESASRLCPLMLEAPTEPARPPETMHPGALLEIAVGGMVARMPLATDGSTLARIVRALKGAS
jgi:transposase